MDWSMIGAVGEVLGAVAVVLSVAYLARQVQENSRAAQSTQYHRINQETISFAEGIAHQNEWSDIVFRGFVDRESLTPPEILRFNAGMLGIFRAWEARFWHAREGGVHDWGAQGNLRMMIDVLGYPGAQRYWHDRGHWFSEEFKAEVDGILESAEPNMLRSYGIDV
jgi:hypothetical protein